MANDLGAEVQAIELLVVIPALYQLMPYFMRVNGTLAALSIIVSENLNVPNTSRTRQDECTC